MSKRNAAIYREAAEVVCNDRDAFSCSAIGRISGNMCGSQRAAYNALFRPNEYGSYAWLHYARDRGMLDGVSMQNWRILALCFMAAIEESK